MEIKPTTTPVSLPVNDTQRLDSTSRQVDTADRAAFDARFDSSAAGAADAVAAPVVDAGETRIGQDPWIGEGNVAQRLLLTGVPTQAGLGDISAGSLPDAVRAAVDFVFAGES